MKKILYILVIAVSTICFGQSADKLVGEISFVTNSHLYAKFDQTNSIEIGDTLYILQNDKYISAMRVEYKSSKRVSGISLVDFKLSKGLNLYAYIKKKPSVDKVVVAKKNETEAIKKEQPIVKTPKVATSSKLNSADISGRFSVTSYTSLATNNSWENQRWRYRFSLYGENLVDSKLNFDTYIVFAYRTDRTNLIKDNINNALKIYSLNASYKVTPSLTLSLGRKINKSVTNIGAYDGIDFSYKFLHYEVGAILGSRPNWSDYSLNGKLFQYGVFAKRTDKLSSGMMTNSFGAFEQTNHGKTDRRFLYYQHSNNLITNLRMFLSTEVDLYKLEKGIASSQFSLTSLYTSLNYSPTRAISFSGSYDSRKNVIYFETFKNIADKLLEEATRQGFRISTTLRPINKLMMSISYGFSKRESQFKGSNNTRFYVNYSRLPIIDASISGSLTNLKTNYVNGNIYGFGLNKNFFSGYIDFQASYRKVNYNYNISDYKLNQDIAGFSIYANILRNLSLSINYEGVFEKSRSQTLLYINIGTRF